MNLNNLYFHCIAFEPFGAFCLVMTMYQCVTGKEGSLGSYAVLQVMQFTRGSCCQRLYEVAGGAPERVFMMNSDRKSWLEDTASPALVAVTSQSGFFGMFKHAFSFCL